MKNAKVSAAVPIIREFHAKQFAHMKLKEAFTQLSWVIEQEPEEVEQLYLLVGPSGCGKSTLMKRLETDIRKKYITEMEVDPGMVPVIHVRLTAPQDGNFNWKDFFSRLIEQFNDVLVRRKVILHPEAILNGESVITIRSLVREELRRAARNAFAFRKTKFLLLDEGGHLLLTKSSITPRFQFELIKSVAQELNIPIILAGDYTLLRILELNGQLTRRTEVIHFSRYLVSEMSEINGCYSQSFRDTIYSLLEAMPVPKEDGLIDHIDYFYEFSIGNIGLLKKWLKRALWQALMSDDGVLTRECLEATRWNRKSLRLMLEESKYGERALEDIEDDELTKELGLQQTASIHVLTGNFKSNGITEEETQGKKRKLSRRPGIRNPSRDVVGGI